VYRKILVGTDGSPTAGKAVARAVEVAAATGAQLTVLAVGAPGKTRAVVEAEVTRHAESGVTISADVREGDPAAVLVETAEAEGYDLLVLGNKGMTGVSRFFLGSVPNKVSHHVGCSLLIVRTT
jgi:nucleotide-binding universal stress UspA family protein